MAGSTAVLAAILIIDIVAFGLAIGAEQSRPSARLETDAQKDWTYCAYRPDGATAMGGAALALLLVGQAVAAVASRCFCCGAALRPGGARACALVLFISSWLTFVIAEACLLAGLVQTAYHTGYRTVYFENPPDCETVRKGTFGAGAAFAFITCLLTSGYYYNFSKSRVNFHRREATIGMTPL
ncbi:hypothetical protein PR202_ga07445 [Eleusine coracana subsp. coracana]|uniref:Fiber protein Fb34 n=1 Tax=Eleusine coracana subsp. coracana TaxID=191504 RepID=A0AAV5BYQ1_ELECO|nr:hypothetical protein QOZ80_2AG0112360 [Eleusine coracana subsp. coracana]GJM91102.1 hypothetical protein PR202_ga07445 [Eleusine coracana subsp. coracana]